VSFVICGRVHSTVVCYSVQALERTETGCSWLCWGGDRFVLMMITSMIMENVIPQCGCAARVMVLGLLRTTSTKVAYERRIVLNVIH
jgi:hypothetical protein